MSLYRKALDRSRLWALMSQDKMLAATSREVAYYRLKAVIVFDRVMLGRV